MTSPIFIPHGGGPLPLLNDPRHQTLISFLQQLPTTLEKPSAIVVISAHWEESTFAITSHPNPALLYDYSGFPKESYEITYPVSGHPVLAQQIEQLLRQANLPTSQTTSRKLDHGVFVPLKLMYPSADIPVVQVSLHRSLDPSLHIRLGEALKGLDDSILLLGSGFSYHNLRAFFSPDPRHREANVAFHQWLRQVCTQMSRSEMLEHLRQWTIAPSSQLCHPRSEHLLPLMVCAGAGRGVAKSIFDGVIFGKQSLGLQW